MTSKNGNMMSLYTVVEIGNSKCIKITDQLLGLKILFSTLSPFLLKIKSVKTKSEMDIHMMFGDQLPLINVPPISNGDV